jgi:hypothetical protein
LPKTSERIFRRWGATQKVVCSIDIIPIGKKRESKQRPRDC